MCRQGVDLHDPPHDSRRRLRHDVPAGRAVLTGDGSLVRSSFGVYDTGTDRPRENLLLLK